MQANAAAPQLVIHAVQRCACVACVRQQVDQTPQLWLDALTAPYLKQAPVSGCTVSTTLTCCTVVALSSHGVVAPAGAKQVVVVVAARGCSHKAAVWGDHRQHAAAGWAAAAVAGAVAHPDDRNQLPPPKVPAGLRRLHGLHTGGLCCRCGPRLAVTWAAQLVAAVKGSVPAAGAPASSPQTWAGCPGTTSEGCG
jgi:hypothetical protein